jgi:hypothetical protein
MALEFSGWRVAPDVTSGRMGATFTDGDLNLENPKFGELEYGQILVDPMPEGHVQVLCEGEYVLPLAEHMADYLRAEGLTVELKMNERNNPFEEVSL